jgi:aryl-alcohol dehydrogenase-like predicted oxidoreductase
MLQRDIEQDQLPYCREQGIAVLAYSPLARGLLTGAVGPERKFEPGDHRAGLAMFSSDNRRRVARLLEQFRPIAEQHKVTLAQLVIAWTLAQPGLTHALCGARNAKQAIENAAAGDIELSDSELAAMDRAISSSLT